MPLFSMPLRTISRGDVERVILEQHPESDSLEFKETLPAKGDGSPDYWINGESRIGNRARDEILEEIVAFANAHGGHLIIGISETEESPHRANEIRAVRGCNDLAERLGYLVRDCIDPQLPVIGIVGIPTDDDGHGVIVIRVPQSRMAPHRVTTSLNCCIRRSDRCEKMTMREIQDLTIHRERGLEKIDSIFQKRREGFESAVSLSKNSLGMRSTLIPIGSELYIDRVHKNKDIIPFCEYVNYKSGTSISRVGYPFNLLPAKPILRGTQYLDDTGNCLVKKEIYCSGLIEFSIFFVTDRSEDLAVFPEWVLGLAVNSMFTAHRFRRVAGAMDCEYGIEIELFRNGGPLVLYGYANRPLFGPRGALESNPLLFPRLSMGSFSEVSNLARMIRVDLYDSAGINMQSEAFELAIPEELLD
jgi:Putative DNA-binding domain